MSIDARTWFVLGVYHGMLLQNRAKSREESRNTGEARFPILIHARPSWKTILYEIDRVQQAGRE